MTKPLLLLLVPLLLTSGCTQQVDDSDPDPVVAANSEALTRESVKAVAVVGQLAQAVRSLADRDPSMDGTDPTTTENPSAPECSTIEWRPLMPRRISVTFDGCILPGGVPLDGTATGWLRHDGVRGQVGVEIDELTVGGLYVDGFIVVANDGLTAADIEADVSLEGPDGSIRIAFDAHVSVAGGVLQLDGAGSFDRDGSQWAGDATGLRWTDYTHCYPTEGSLDVDAPGFPPISVVFDGTETMQVQLGRFAPITQPVPACPSL